MPEAIRKYCEMQDIRIHTYTFCTLYFVGIANKVPRPLSRAHTDAIVVKGMYLEVLWFSC